MREWHLIVLVSTASLWLSLVPVTHPEQSVSGESPASTLPVQLPPSAPTSGLTDVLQVWTVDAMTRVGQQDAVQPHHSIALHAARNEYEPFQVIVSARGGDLTDVRATISDLRGAAGVVRREHITLYRARYIDVTTPSPLSPLPPEPVADALIPFVDPSTNRELNGPLYDAHPFVIRAGKNVPLWTDVYVPAHTAAGIYTATITISATDGSARRLRKEVPITLTVWNFTLPTKSYQRSSFGLSPQQLRAYYQLDLAADETRYQMLLAQYRAMLLQHRLMPTPLSVIDYAIDEATGVVTPPGSKRPEFDRNSTTDLANYLHVNGINALRISLSADRPYDDAFGSHRAQTKQYLASLANVYRQNDEEILLYVYPIDEPDSARAYQTIRNWATLVDEANAEYGVNIKFLLTEQPEPQQPEWGNLAGYVDIWVPCCGTVWRDLEAPNGNRTIAKRLAAGDEVWWYTALVQQSIEWMEQHDWPDTLSQNYTPVWLLDYPPINYRISSWLNQHYGFTGLLYWATNHWTMTSDVWTDPATYVHSGNTFNGEGLLLYPGDMATVGFDGPIASMRLKWLRESIEDYDYIQLLKEKGEAEYALDQVHTVARGMTDWALNTSLLYAARQQLGERLSMIESE